MAEATATTTHHRLVTGDGVEIAADLASVAEPTGMAILAHPHPSYGGTRHVPVIEAWFRRLPAAGITTIRFDFRGGGESGGTHAGGAPEQLDVEAAIDALPHATGLPLIAVGWSFGAEVLLAHRSPRIDAWVAVATSMGV